MTSPSVHDSLHALIGCAPDDLVTYFEAGVFRKNPNARINCLDLPGSLEYSRAMQGIAVVDRLGLVVLDDADDSNPFAYVSRGCGAGAIIHFRHDPEPAFKFRSLSGFLKALDQLPAEGGDIDELEPDGSLSLDATAEVAALLLEDSEDAQSLLSLYLPVSAALPPAVTEKLVIHDDFLIREAFAYWLKNRPEVTNLPLAEQLAEDPYDQVQRPAKEAVNRIKRLHFAGG